MTLGIHDLIGTGMGLACFCGYPRVIWSLLQAGVGDIFLLQIQFANNLVGQGQRSINCLGIEGQDENVGIGSGNLYALRQADRKWERRAALLTF